MSVTFNVPNSQAYEENIPCYCLRDECHPDPGCIDCGGKGFWLYKSTKYEINWSNINARTFLIGLYTLAQQDYDVDSDLVGSISIEMLLSLRDKIIKTITMQSSVTDIKELLSSLSMVRISAVITLTMHSHDQSHTRVDYVRTHGPTRNTTHRSHHSIKEELST